MRQQSWQRPSVIKNCFANHYAARCERIVEFVGSGGNGGLISLVQHEDGRLTVDVYRYGPRVEVRVGKPDASAKGKQGV
jgi:hypothetical protein